MRTTAEPTAAELSGLVSNGRVNRRLYTDAEVFNLEMLRIFGQAWIYVGHASQLREAGDFITTRIARNRLATPNSLPAPITRGLTAPTGPSIQFPWLTATVLISPRGETTSVLSAWPGSTAIAASFSPAKAIMALRLRRSWGRTCVRRLILLSIDRPTAKFR